MIRPLLLLFFLPLLLLTREALGEVVRIEGEAPAYQGKDVKLVGVTDHVTQMDTVLATGKVGKEDSSFSLRSRISRIRPAWVRIGNAEAKIYLEPGGDYDVEFPAIPEDRIERMHGHTEVEMTFYELPQHDANNLVIDFNRVYERFFAKNYRAIGIQYASGGSYMRERGDLEQKRDSLTQESIRRTPSMKQLADSLENTLEERYAEVDKPWFRTHYRHALASLHEVADRNKDESYERYFRDEEVRAYNEEYMKHFLAFYDKYLIDFARRHDSLFDLRHVLSREKDPEPILEALRSEEAEHLGREGLRELVLIDGMFDAFYHRKGFDREGIHAVLDSLASKGSRKAIRGTAGHLSDFLSKRQRGTKAPDFRLLDRDTNSIGLESLKGSPIYLNFWATWNETSLKDLRMIEKLHEEYGDQVQFVSISTDDKLRDMTGFLEEHPDYDWTFLYSGSKEEVEERYQVASIPAYYLLDAEARFLKLPGPKPGENARKKIHRLYKRILREKKRKRPGRRGWDH